jgi:pimeloyl-ACP methyl ester carboxylesterase
MIVTAIAIAAAILCGLAAYTEIERRRIERAYPPAGRFVEVEGGRLHLLELGPADAPPVVLLHGASGNLGDMRLALGERLATRYRVIVIDRPGHGWSDRPSGNADASPARQAMLIHQALERIGVRRAILVGHSWSGALATAYALAFPDAVIGLVLLAPVTHPWPGGVAWYNNVLTTPVIGPLFARMLGLPLGELLIEAAVSAVFAPQRPPDGYLIKAGGRMFLRPAELTANAWDIVQLRAFVTAQAPNYGAIKVPTAIITGDIDETVSTKIHSQAIAALVPRVRLQVLPGIGHMVQHAVPDRIVEAVDEIVAGRF